MQELIDFLSLSDPNIRYVVLGVMLLGASTAIVGSFIYLQKKSLVGDAIAHAVLPGICLAFILAEQKNPLVLLLGAFVTGWLSILSIDFITEKTRLKADTAIGLVLSVFFGVGILLLTYIQGSGNAAQSGLNNFLFGQAASLLKQDVITLSIIAVILIISTWLLFKEFKLISFDEDYAASMGLPVKALEIFLSTLTVLAVAVGIQAVGVVLMAAMLITPAAAARYWTNNLRTMVLIAAIFGAVSGVIGSFVSYSAPKMPTGPWVIMAISIIAFISMLFAPRRGVIFKNIRRRRKKQKTLEENILKIFWHLGEKENDFHTERSIKELQERRFINKEKLQSGIKALKKDGYLESKGKLYTLTVSGKKEGQRIARIHRLWEMYMSKYLKMPPDHVHDGAESLEHFITPELEKELLEQLDYPERDPHDKPIPYETEDINEYSEVL